MHRREKESACAAEQSITEHRGMGKHWAVPPSPCKGPSHSLHRNGKNKTKVARIKQRLQEQLFLSSLLFKCCTSGLGVDQNTSLYNWLTSFFFIVLFSAHCKWQEEACKKWKAGEKALVTLSALCVGFLPATVTGFSAAPVRNKISWVTLCPGIQEVHPGHQRYNIPRRSDGATEKGRRSGEVMRGLTWTKSVVPCGCPRNGDQGKAEMPRQRAAREEDDVRLPGIQPPNSHNA